MCEPKAQRRKHGLFFVGESGVGKTTMCLKAIETLKRRYFAMSQSDAELWAQVTDFLQALRQMNPGAYNLLEKEMQNFGEHQLREKAVLVAAKRGLVLFIDELNTDRNLRLEETLNQVSVIPVYLTAYVIPSRRRFCLRVLEEMCTTIFT